LTDRFGPDEVVGLAASGEIHARHPLAQAVVRHSEERHIESPLHEECEVVLGMEMRAELHGNRLPVRSHALVEQHGININDDARQGLRRLHEDAATAVCRLYATNRGRPRRRVVG
jgi:cation-transporting P-type ATPase C